MNKIDTEPLLLSITPIIPVDDMNKALKFYCEKLGFENIYDSKEYEEGPINYAVLYRKNVCIHFQLFESIKGITMPMLKFPVKNIEEIFIEFKKRAALPSDKKIYETAWNTKEIAFYDPFMTGLTFYESLSRSFSTRF